MSVSQKKKTLVQGDLTLMEVKSKFEAEFRRFALKRNQFKDFQEFYDFLKKMHKLESIPFLVWYRDAQHGDLLPINNTENCLYALNMTVPLLRLFLQKGDKHEHGNVLTQSKRSMNFNPSAVSAKQRLQISTPQDFRRVSAIIDVDILPESVRRVRLCKHLSDKPLGFYIRDGTSIRVTADGLEKVPGIFVSRLVPGGLADSTGLLSVNDEVLEVNGIEVAGKSLDQVTEMMVANSHNLVVTVKPVNQIPTKTSKDSLEMRPSSHFPQKPSPLAAKVANGSGYKAGVITRNDMETIDSDEDEPVVADGVVHV